MDKTLIYRKKAIDSHHNNSSVFYDRYKNQETNPYADEFVYGRKKIFEFIFPYLKRNLNKNAKIIDVGCGSGYFLNKLKESGYDVVGVEPAEGMREYTKKQNKELKIIDASVDNLPFPDNHFDALSAIEVFRYLYEDDIIKGYSECLRVLKPGGTMIVSLVNRYALDGFNVYYYFKFFAEKIFKKEIVNYCNFVSPNSVKKIFKKEFNQDIETYGFLFSPIRIIYNINKKLGMTVAKKIEPFDNYLAKKKWWKPFAGHLILILKKKE